MLAGRVLSKYKVDEKLTLDDIGNASRIRNRPTTSIFASVLLRADEIPASVVRRHVVRLSLLPGVRRELMTNRRC